jgi:nucleotide-binding universal stress UspA family protein
VSSQNQVLIPIDGSELSAQILGPLGALLERNHPCVTLLCVVPEWEADSELPPAREALAQVARTLEEQGVSTLQRLERGDPAEVILSVALETEPDLVAMSTHGRTGLGRLVRGSVAERVLRECTAPLFLCNPSGIEQDPLRSTFRRILVPLDGSKNSDAILDLAAEWALAFGSTVTLFRVEPLVPTTPPAPIVLTNAWDIERTRASIEDQRQRLADAGVKVEVQAACGMEVREILNAAEGADLVAMSTHGRSGLSRWWFGSVAEAVVRHCPAPLLVLRPRAS